MFPIPKSCQNVLSVERRFFAVSWDARQGGGVKRGYTPPGFNEPGSLGVQNLIFQRLRFTNPNFPSDYTETLGGGKSLTVLENLGETLEVLQ